MERDAKLMRRDKPFVFTNLKSYEGEASLAVRAFHKEGDHLFDGASTSPWPSLAKEGSFA